MPFFKSRIFSWCNTSHFQMLVLCKIRRVIKHLFAVPPHFSLTVNDSVIVMSQNSNPSCLRGTCRGALGYSRPEWGWKMHCGTCGNYTLLSYEEKSHVKARCEIQSIFKYHKVAVVRIWTKPEAVIPWELKRRPKTISVFPTPGAIPRELLGSLRVVFRWMLLYQLIISSLQNTGWFWCRPLIASLEPATEKMGGTQQLSIKETLYSRILKAY